MTQTKIDPARIRRAWKRLADKGFRLPPPTMEFFRLELLPAEECAGGAQEGGTREDAPAAEMSPQPEGTGLVLAFTPDERMCNPGGIVQGGVIAGVLDEAIGVLTAALAQGRPFTTAHLALDYFAPARPGERYLARAWLVRRGRRRMVVDAELFVAERADRPLARASAQQLFLDLVAPPREGGDAEGG